MGGGTRKRSHTSSHKHQKTRKQSKLSCHIPIQVPAFNYSLDQQQTKGNDFFRYINQRWLDSVKIPATKAIYGLSEEVEECIYTATVKLLQEIQENPKSKEEKFLQSLSKSCLHSRVQQNSVETLKEELKKLSCIETPADVFQHLARLSAMNFPSVLGLSYTVDKDKKIQLLLNGSPPSLPPPFYSNPTKMREYKELLKTLADLLDVPGLEKVIGMEKKILFTLENTWTPVRSKIKGAGLGKKFKIDWSVWFAEHGDAGWKKRDIYYSSGKYLRFISRMLKEIPIASWKLYIARSIIFTVLEYLPPPYDELYFMFFRQSDQGQKEKMPQEELMVKTVQTLCSDIFSPIFWKAFGSKEVDTMGRPFVELLQKAAIRRLKSTEWLEAKTKASAIEKIEKLQIEVVRPRRWASTDIPEMDENNLLKNLFTLGKEMIKKMFNRLGYEYRFWDEGLYRVNAYYYTENNEIMIPYGTMLPPYFIGEESKVAWNLGN